MCVLSVVIDIQTSLMNLTFTQQLVRCTFCCSVVYSILFTVFSAVHMYSSYSFFYYCCHRTVPRTYLITIGQTVQSAYALKRGQRSLMLMLVQACCIIAPAIFTVRLCEAYTRGIAVDMNIVRCP